MENDHIEAERILQLIDTRISKPKKAIYRTGMGAVLCIIIEEYLQTKKNQANEHV